MLGLHGMFLSTDAAATRAFLRDKLGFPFTDVGDGWLIFDMAEADLGCHPAEKPGHDLSFFTDDVARTVEEWKAEGVRFTKEIEDHGYGLVTYFELPGVGPVQLYQPRYEKGTRP